jgi:hypothetical protein
MKKSFWSSNPFRIALAVLIVLGGAAAMVAATLQNLGVILAPQASASSGTSISKNAHCRHMTEEECVIQHNAWKFSQTLIGKTESEAIANAQLNNFQVRTVSRDREQIVITADLNLARVDLWVRHNIVVRATTG